MRHMPCQDGHHGSNLKPFSLSFPRLAGFNDVIRVHHQSRYTTGSQDQSSVVNINQCSVIRSLDQSNTHFSRIETWTHIHMHARKHPPVHIVEHDVKEEAMCTTCFKDEKTAKRGILSRDENTDSRSFVSHFFLNKKGSPLAIRLPRVSLVSMDPSHISFGSRGNSNQKRLIHSFPLDSCISGHSLPDLM